MYLQLSCRTQVTSCWYCYVAKSVLVLSHNCSDAQWALFLACFVVFISALGLFLLPAFSFSSQNIAYRRFLIGQCHGAHPTLYKCIFPFNPPCSMDPNTSNSVAPSRFPPPLLPLPFFFLICFFFFLVFFFSAGELSAAEAAGGAQHGPFFLFWSSSS